MHDSIRSQRVHMWRIARDTVSHDKQGSRDLETALEQIEARVGQRSRLALLLVDEMRLISARVCVRACACARVRLRACVGASVSVRVRAYVCACARARRQTETNPVRGNFVRSCPGLCGTVGSLTARLASKS